MRLRGSFKTRHPRDKIFAKQGFCINGEDLAVSGFSRRLYWIPAVLTPYGRAAGMTAKGFLKRH